MKIILIGENGQTSEFECENGDEVMRKIREASVSVDPERVVSFPPFAGVAFGSISTWAPTVKDRSDPWSRSGRRWNGNTEAPGTFEARVERNRAKAKAAKAARKKQRGK